jgi:hypothetical protein
MDINDILNAELTSDPLARGYSGMNDAEVLADLKTEYRERNVERMTASEVLNAVDKVEYDALTDTEKDTFWRLMHMGDLNPWGVEADIMVDIFTGGSTTISTLNAARVVSISRAEELGISSVREGDIVRVRT